MKRYCGPNGLQRLLAAAVSALTVLLLLIPIPARAAGEESQTIRVGYVNAINYEEGGEGEYKRGAGYEYLQKISYLTGWNYEYVYGSFTECYEMLTRGEIDLFGNVSYTPERAEAVDFSAYPQGKDTYWLYTSKRRAELATGDIRLLEGCRIGVTEGSFQEGLLREWLDNNHIQATVLPFSGYEALMEALSGGEADVIAAPDLSVSYDCLAIVSIGASDYYFAVSKTRPDVLSQLNRALYEIQNAETDYNSRLFSRYYYKTASGLAFNDEEKQWLAGHDNTLRLGYFRDELPFSGEEDGELTGILATVADSLVREYGIQVESRAYDTITEMKAALRAGEVDVIGPVVTDFYLAEEDGLILTDAIVSTTPVILYQGESYQTGLRSIAVTENGIFSPGIVGVLFPEAEQVPCASQEECLRAVAEGKAGSTVIPSSRINILSDSKVMEKLSFAEMAKRTEVGLLTSRESRRAATILNKGIEQSSQLLSGVVLAQHSVGSEAATLRKFVSGHIGLIISLAAAIILVLGILLRRLYVSKKQLVAALDDAKNANTANIAKTTFLNNMSHDIRTPMNAIMGFTNIALKQQPGAEIRACLDKIRQSSEYLLALINDVLDISRIESGNVQYAPVPVDITAVTDGVLNIARGFLIDRDLELRVRRTPPTARWVLADEVRIREVLINIISNAVKFTDDGGTITVEVWDRPGKDSRHTVVCYRISDTGIGMDEAFQPKIFDEFSQEDAGARTQYKGTGLGMTITKRYVELMGGTISVESRKGAGTSFTVELPLERTDPVASEPSPPVLARDLRGIRILMAEDNDLNAEIAGMLLEENGMTVTRVSDGAEAVERFRESPEGSFDLILMDIMMPRMNGYEAARAIRGMEGRPDGQRIPIVAMTANAFSEDIQAALGAGMNAHLSKPIDMDEVIRVIARQLAPGPEGPRPTAPKQEEA